MVASTAMNAEQQRLDDNRQSEAWTRWGPYLSDRQWGTVREDYSESGTAWEYFTHDQARSRAYRWGEDGLGGFCDRRGELCFALAFWNGRDPILKERLFGLTNSEGNHGEDVKEYYFFLDNTPTHSYQRWLYKYPQLEFPYKQLIEENGRRTKNDPEYELLDTGVFDQDQYFDITVESAKASPDDICIRVHVANHSAELAHLDVLPTLWFRNTWSWNGTLPPSSLKLVDGAIQATAAQNATFWLFCEGGSEFLFTQNESNLQRLYGSENAAPYVKDAFHEYVIHGQKDAVNPGQTGTKAAVHYQLAVEAGQTIVLQLRFTNQHSVTPFDDGYAQIFTQRQQESDEFYEAITPGLDADRRAIQRQAFAGLLWSKQFYSYDVRNWLAGDAAKPAPPPQRQTGRNEDWWTLCAEEVISMPDTWEYPWFAAWDLAFHCVTFAVIDAEFAKQQLLLLTRDRYMHPSGQLPAYEWAFGDVNPPVQAWAAWRIYQIDQKRCGKGDKAFLERIFHRLLLYFTWWVNRKDTRGQNLFQGGFLGLDNIGVFDRSKPLPMGGYLEQADGTAWMGLFALNMLTISLELAREDESYSDIAVKFFEHFLYIANAINRIGQNRLPLWDDEDGFYYDALHLADGQSALMKVRSIVGLTPLFAIETLEPSFLETIPGLNEQIEWFLKNRPELAGCIASLQSPGEGDRRLLSMTGPESLRRILRYLLDESEFLSPHGIRSVSRVHQDHPYRYDWEGTTYQVDYEPAESTSGLFGGNSNWRGPIWFPINYLLIESLQKFHHYLGDDFKVECPVGSGQMLDLWSVSIYLEERLISIFLQENGRRPVYGGTDKFQQDPHWRDNLLFFEYFHGDNGAGLGASHQTGWTALVAKLIQQTNEHP